MNTKLLTLGVLAALLAVSMPANAYHIEAPVSVNGDDPRTWDAATSVISPVDEPCANSLTAATVALVVGTLTSLPPPLGGPGGILTLLLADGCLFAPALTSGTLVFALTLCEQNDVGFAFPDEVSSVGHGGLCSMSPGYDNNASCDWAGNLGGSDALGRSNGNGPNYDLDPNASGNVCEDVSAGDEMGALDSGTFDYYEFRMTDTGATGGLATFTVQVNGIGCSFQGTSGYVEMKFAYIVSDGHVAGFVNGAPSGTTGYEVVSHGSSLASTPAADCATGDPTPIYYS